MVSELGRVAGVTCSLPRVARIEAHAPFSHQCAVPRPQGALFLIWGDWIYRHKHDAAGNPEPGPGHAIISHHEDPVRT